MTFYDKVIEFVDLAYEQPDEIIERMKRPEILELRKYEYPLIPTHVGNSIKKLLLRLLKEKTDGNIAMGLFLDSLEAIIVDDDPEEIRTFQDIGQLIVENPLELL